MRADNDRTGTGVPESKTIYVVSLGCPKNLVDTEIMLGHLTKAGWEVVGEPRGAAVLLVNTCAFIAPASQEAVETILEMAAHKEKAPGQRLVVTGCLVQRYAGELEGLLPEVDLWIGVNDFCRLSEILGGDEVEGGRRLFCSRSPYDYAERQPRYGVTPWYLGYLKIAEGCSHGCTFCTIPRLRGPYRSRPLATLRAEAQRLAAGGVKEVILVAQDTTAYGQEWGGHPGLPELLAELAGISGLLWLRVLYTYPNRISEHLLETMAAIPKVLPYIDFPIQHGHDEILRRMGRGYRRWEILEVCRQIRRYLPQATLRSTVMVGFPGETEEHFQSLLALVEEVRFDHLGVFLYSKEEGTAAAGFSGAVPRRQARSRARRLKALQAMIVKEKLKSLVGTVQPVLVEGVSEESEYLLKGRLRSQAPEIDGQVLIRAGEGRVGEVQPVRIVRAIPPDVLGEIVS